MPTQLKSNKETLQQNNLTIAKADKSKAIVIINKDYLIQKIGFFIQENQITCSTKGPTEFYQKTNPTGNLKIQYADR